MRKKKKMVKFLETEQIKEFESPLVNRAKEALESEEMTTTDKIAVRDFAVITLVYSCALRISEACNLTMQDVDFGRKLLYVIDGKGGDRTVPIPEPTIKVLQEWLDIRPKWNGNNYFFTNVKGTTRPGQARPLMPRYYGKLFEKLADESGVRLRDGQKPHPHTLRHSRAMELFDNDVPLDVLQALLGHRDISTTQIYAETRSTKVIEAQQKVIGGIVTI